jgi:hypothetical protein
VSRSDEPKYDGEKYSGGGTLTCWLAPVVASVCACLFVRRLCRVGAGNSSGHRE